MPRNSQGLYQLPAGNPVISGTLIESVWANQTMSDLGDALTGSLPRNGSAPMTGPLTLEPSPPTQSRHATSKAYVDSLLTYATGLPIGAIVAYAGSQTLVGFLLCNGQPVSRTTYADLFATVGTIYGAGDGVNTFNLPDLQNEFIRGKGGSRTLGSKQAGMVGPHNHQVTDPGHAHAVSDPVHSHGVSQSAHSHGVSDPGHSHTSPASTGIGGGVNQVRATTLGTDNSYTTNAAATGVSIAAANANISVAGAQSGVTVAAAGTGLTVAASTGAENVPQNTALDFYIKASQDAAGPTTLTSVDTDDHEMIDVDLTLPNAPLLVIKSNIPFGTVKLDQNGKVPLANSQSGIQTFLGLWDASTGQNPTEAGGSYVNGDTFLIGAGGTINLYDPATELETPTLTNVGDEIINVVGSAEQPSGWYYIVAVTGGVVASDVQFIPAGGVTSTNVQDAIVEVQGNIPVTAAEVPFVPAGTIAATNVQTAIQELDTEKLAITGGTLTGNLNFSGAGRRITGDFSNATVADRLMFQTSTPSSPTAIAVIPSAGGGAASLSAFSNETPTISDAQLQMLATVTESSIRALSPAGTFKPLTFYIGGAERMRIATDGTISMNATTAVKVPTGTEAERPVPETGHFRFNTTTTQFEGYNGSAWAGVIGSDTPTFTGVLTTEQKINVTQPYGVLQVNGVDALRFGSDNSGQLAGFRNVLINGNLRINQRGVTIAAAANGAYGPDRWKKVDASNMTQIVEDGNYRPSTVYTLSGTNVTTQQITSPASGHWTIPSIPITATNVQLEEGSIATPFEQRPIGLELSLCQRYYQKYDLGTDIHGSMLASSTYTPNVTTPIPEMRDAPTVTPSGFTIYAGPSTATLTASATKTNRINHYINKGANAWGASSNTFTYTVSLSAEL